MVVALFVVVLCIRHGLNQIVIGIALTIGAEGLTSLLHHHLENPTMSRIAMFLTVSVLTMVALSVALASCSRSTSAPQSVDPASSTRSPASSQPSSPLASSAPSQNAPVASSVSLVTSSAASAPPAPSAASPSLIGPGGAPLPQTEDKPSASSAAFRKNVELVAAAILSGDPIPAHPAFFPLVGYRQVKAIADPARDYERRLLASFDRDVREYHRALGKDPSGVTFAGIDVPEARAEWIKPGREGNKVGYYRVLRSKLRFTLASGKEKSFELTSLISWRGEWYVVHLNGFD